MIAIIRTIILGALLLLLITLDFYSVGFVFADKFQKDMQYYSSACRRDARLVSIIRQGASIKAAKEQKVLGRLLLWLVCRKYKHCGRNKAKPYFSVNKPLPKRANTGKDFCPYGIGV